MKNSRLMLWLVALSLMAGCQQPMKAPPMTLTEEPRVTGIGAAHDGFVDGVSIRRPIKVGHTVETHGMLVFNAVQSSDDQQTYQNFNVILGANKDDLTLAKGRFIKSSVSFYLDYGWVYLYGDGPMADTDRVSAQAEGSAMIIQIDNDNRVDRVYYVDGLEGKRLWVTPTGKATENMMAKADLDHYMEVDDDGNITGPAEVPADADDPIRVFFEYVMEQVGPFK